MPRESFPSAGERSQLGEFFVVTRVLAANVAVWGLIKAVQVAEKLGLWEQLRSEL